MTIYGGEIYGSSDQAVLNVEAQYAKDSVLILYDTDDNLRLYSTSGAVGPSEGISGISTVKWVINSFFSSSRLFRNVQCTKKRPNWKWIWLFNEQRGGVRTL